MKFINLIRSEFIKNYSIKKLILIILTMLISVLVLSEGFLFLDDRSVQISGKDAIETINNRYQQLLAIEDKSLDDEYELYYFRVELETYKYIYENEISDDWRLDLLVSIREKVLENKVIEIYREHPEQININTICNSSSMVDYRPRGFYSNAEFLCESDDVDALEKENNKIIDDYEKLLKENKYYLYLSYQNANGLNESMSSNEKELAQVIIDEKIEDAKDFRVLNYLQYSEPRKCDLLDDVMVTFETEEDKEEYIKDCYKIEKNDKRKEKSAIILYSSKHDIPHDISYTEWRGPNRHYTYTTSKHLTNKVFHLSLVVIILVAITSSGIISGEHNKGTIKNLISSPVKRWKILLSKFIYLILHMYIIWLIGLIIMYFYAGFRLGFNDLLLPKLVYTGGSVVEVNYFLYLLMQMFVSSIPVIACLSILLFLSAITLNTAVTASITSILGIMPPILFYICSNFGIKSLTYLPVMYFDSGLIYDAGEWYIRIIDQFDFSLGKGIIISLITIVVLYVMTNIVYIKRDIKN